VDASLPNMLKGDEARIRQVLVNLLSNAVKYTHKGFVRLTLTYHVDPVDSNVIRLVYEVSDSGIGIKEEDMPGLFNSFTRLDMKKNQGVEGTGLGLAISKNICKAMGGDVNADSKYGEGSIFTAVLPQIIDGKDPIALVENSGEKPVLYYEKQPLYVKSMVFALNNMSVPVTIKSETEDFFQALSEGKYTFAFINIDLAERARELVKKQSLATTLVLLANTGETIRNMPVLSRPVYAIPLANVLNHNTETASKWKGGHFIAPDARILVVDDIHTNLVVTSGLLAIYKSHVDTCTSGAAAISMVQKKHYDIVFMDHMMPEMDGIEAAKAIRAMEGDYYKNLPIIALTANAIIGMKEMFLSNGFNDYLSKPIEVLKLDDTLAAWLPGDKQVLYIEEQAPTETQSVIPDGFLVEGVDLRAGKARYTEKAFLEVLRSYYLHTPELLGKINNLNYRELAGDLSEEAIKDYTITVHGIKGASFGICADTVAKQAEALEGAGKSRDIKFIEMNNIRFIEEAEKIIGGIKELLALIASQAGAKPVCGKPDPALLERLTDAAGHYNVKVMDEILEKLESYEYEQGGELVEWLREQVDNLEYEAICRKLEEL
jgi:CheY-like chemotaxis protein